MDALVFFFNKVVIAGLVTGSIYALGAVGVTLVFAILRFAHFAHGDLMALGGGIALALTLAFPHAGALFGLPSAFVLMPFAMALTVIVALLADRWFYAPLRASGIRPVVLVMASLGVALMLQGLIRLIAGADAHSLYVAERKDIFRLALPFELARRKIVITEPQILIMLFTIAAVVFLHWFLTRTKTGKAMRAMSDNPDLARLSGIPVSHVVRITWIIAGALAAAAGTLLSLDVTWKPDMSFNLLLPIFAAAIVGGVGQPYGAIAGGFLVGFAEVLSIFNWSILLRPLKPYLESLIEIPGRLAFVPTEYKLTVPFVILVVVLIWRPTGIFRGKVL
ncbi:branched-chain amino acid ABC transporter permease [Thermopetrobacter sp. TC1]|uniref:branched-chain amino acid ABC transporter permease n=1 Tax=Thermopetrobacter sp. TC1 TaxID=1495045 RepID=UPI00056FAF44|nr:branched-chain amino acid ABC transporter permease [Thermopetrobacter sp. TC1]